MTRRRVEGGEEEAMRWKRGLTRIFVVLWVVWGLGLGAYAVSDVLEVWNIAKYRSVLVHEALPSYAIPDPDPINSAFPDPGTVYRFPSKVTDQQITAYLRAEAEAEADGWLPSSARRVPSTITNQQLTAGLKAKAKSAPRPPSVLENLRGTNWEPIARDERADAPWRYTLTTLGLWLGLGGILAPGLLLVTVRWVWAGFERSPQA
jgi:hypothetical protein